MKIATLKKIIILLAALMIVCTGCGGGDQETSGSGAEKTEEASAPVAEVDIDLTALSSTMVYSEVYDMVNTPEDYIGKTVKMEGVASSFHDEKEDVTYYACVIKDATACCAQGIEYVLKDEKNYPADDEDITVVGEFQTYEAGDGTKFCTLKNAEMVLK